MGVETFQVLFFRLLSQCHGLPYAKRCGMSPAEVQCCDLCSKIILPVNTGWKIAVLCCSGVPVLRKEAIVMPCMKNMGCSSFCGKGWRRSRLLHEAPTQGVRHDWEEKKAGFSWIMTSFDQVIHGIKNQHPFKDIQQIIPYFLKMLFVLSLTKRYWIF